MIIAQIKRSPKIKRSYNIQDNDILYLNSLIIDLRSSKVSRLLYCRVESTSVLLPAKIIHFQRYAIEISSLICRCIAAEVAGITKRNHTTLDMKLSPYFHVVVRAV
jgi:hypothetical protein